MPVRLPQLVKGTGIPRVMGGLCHMAMTHPFRREAFNFQFPVL